jgi:hypothetical protein
MGNQNTNAISLAIIKKDDIKPYDKHDYAEFFKDKSAIKTSEYSTFEEFIEKQSLKDLHHILIV